MSDIFLLTISIFLVVIDGCRKTNETEILPDCELCAYASSFPGTYRGFLTTDVPAEYTPDSATITVEQYLIGDAIEDSTIMRFILEFDYDRVDQSPTKVSISIDNNSGSVLENNRLEYFTPDSFQVAMMTVNYEETVVCNRCGTFRKE